MSKTINRVQVIPDQPTMFAKIDEDADMCQSTEDAGEVMLVTRVTEEGEVELMLVFPIEAGVNSAEIAAETGKSMTYKPAGIKIGLHTFLNVGRSLAVHYQATLVPAEGEPEAVTSEQAGRILLTPGA